MSLPGRWISVAPAVTVSDPATTVVDHRRTVAPRRRRRLPLHLLLLVGVLGVVAATGRLDSSWTSDDGVYAVQAKLVADQGRWDLPNRHPVADPDRRATPLAHTTVTAEGHAYPYVKLPAWILAIAASSRLAGPVLGLHLPAYLGAIAAAAAAWALARRAAPGAEVAAFWAVALGSVLIEATALWAHSVAAALGGVMALLILRAAREGLTPSRVAMLSATCTGSVFLRTEGLLAVAAVAAGLVVAAALTRRASARRAVSCLVGAGVALLSGVVAWLANGAWSASLMVGEAVTVRSDDPPPSGLVEGRITGALRTLIDGRGSVPAATVLGLIAVVLAIASGAEARSWGGHRRAALLGLSAIVLIVMRSVLAEVDGAGLLAAAPLLAVGVGAWRWRESDAAERAVFAFVVTDVALVLATQHAEGGGAEWGGRYLFFVLVPWLVLTLAGVRRTPGSELSSPDPAGQRLQPFRVVMAALVVVPTLTGLVVTQRAAADNDALARRTAAAEGPTVILLDRFVGRWGWRDLPDADRLYAAPNDAGALLERLRPTATGPITVLGSAAETVRADGYRRDRLSSSEVVFRALSGGGR